MTLCADLGREDATTRQLTCLAFVQPRPQSLNCLRSTGRESMQHFQVAETTSPGRSSQPSVAHDRRADWSFFVLAPLAGPGLQKTTNDRRKKTLNRGAQGLRNAMQ